MELSVRKMVLLKYCMRNENQGQTHMRNMSRGMGETIAGEFEVNTRRHEGADFCTFVVGQKEEGRGLLRGAFAIAWPWCAQMQRAMF